MQYFVTIATTGGFGRAARTLHVSQSAISEQMRDLEREIGATLIDRTQRQIRLTAQGEVFLDGAQSTLQAAERAVQAVHQSVRGEIGHLTIGFFVGGNGSFFPTVIRNFRQLHNRIKVSLVEMTPIRQVDALLRGDIDVAFTRPLPAHLHQQLSAQHVYSEPLFAVLHKSHPLARRRVIDMSQLAKERFIMVDRTGSLVVFDKIFALCMEAGFSPTIAATASASSGLLALVEAGEGVAIVPEGSRFLASSEVSFVPIAGNSAYVDLVIAWPTSRMNAVIRAFLDASADAKTRR